MRTTLQVAAAVLGGLVYIIDNPVEASSFRPIALQEILTVAVRIWAPALGADRLDPARQPLTLVREVGRAFGGRGGPLAVASFAVEP
jgi:hypothetical protein